MRLKIITPQSLSTYLNRTDTLLLDLRERDNYDREHIFGAVWADWEKLEDNIDIIIEETGKQINWIILYCDKGNISLLMCRDLGRLGYPVISLKGGYDGYKQYKYINEIS